MPESSQSTATDATFRGRWSPLVLRGGGVALLALGLAAALLYQQFQAEPLKVSGFIEADEIRVGSRVGGRVLRVAAEEGARVRAGQLLVSTLARTQLEAIQLAFIVMLPSVLLSGFMFPRDQMPHVIYAVTFAIPVTYFIEILRGIVLRGGGLPDLLEHVIGLIICCGVIFASSLARFHKQLG